MEESRGDYSLAFLTQCQRCSHAAPSLCLLPNEAGGLCQISILSTSSVEWPGPCQPWPAAQGPQVTHICRIEMFRDYKEGKHNLHFP